MFREILSDLKTYNGDWSQQGFWALVIYRFGRWRYKIRPKIIRMPFSLIYKVLYKVIQITTGIELPCEATIGEGFRIDHFGGIVISGGYAIFGRNCIIRNGVTVGLKNIENPIAPRIGDFVNIGAGAKIIGDISIGDYAQIGANAVVVKDVPEHSIAVGVPAKIIHTNKSTKEC